MTTEETPATLGQRVKLLRTQAAMTQMELAHKAGLNQITIVRTEAGLSPRPLTIKKLARALGVRPQVLTTGVPA